MIMMRTILVLLALAGMAMAQSTPPPPAPPVQWAVVLYDPDVVLPPDQQAELVSPMLRAKCRVTGTIIEVQSIAEPGALDWIPGFPRQGYPVVIFVRRAPNGTAIHQCIAALPRCEADFLLLVQKVQ